MSPIPATLEFNEQELTVIDHNGQAWLTATQLATALGYKQKNRANDVYKRNAQEFTDDMTCVRNLRIQGQKREIRIFSPRGCHLLGMFAKTDKAKEFRVWVLDVLEKQTSDKPNPDDDLITLHKSVLNKTGAAIVTIEDGMQTAKPIQKNAQVYITIIKEGQAPQMMPISREQIETMIREHMPEYALLNTEVLATEISHIKEAMDKSNDLLSRTTQKLDDKILRIEGDNNATT